MGIDHARRPESIKIRRFEYRRYGRNELNEAFAAQGHVRAN